ncbi:helix-turn-helix transcriptional regulator [Microbacterium sp. MPKO10]|uniref:helix-turn-helix transcriptional regulator n=1 Tax=Microbacterium sp. MPKO10 TaxID=2989818 RepID=UPI002235A07D|nr:helix-turn-helix transcriptional regulator [Microbacterium sp. MPKO10]MCW4458789.1 helix-turn-helix transcriptional regulator [Microbacterium sp. MPKO10]
MRTGGSGRADQLGTFLRAYRERLPGTVRTQIRTPGLRREDVAVASNISVDYYTRLEQGRAASMPSAGVVDSLAQTLELNETERAHLHRLTGRAAPEPTGSEDASSALLFFLERLEDTPAQVMSDLGAVLAQNDAADAIFPWVVEHGLQRANVYEHWFCHEEVRAEFPEGHRAAYSEAQAGELRVAIARRQLAGDARGRRFVEDLFERSSEFRRAWDAQQVHDGRDKRIWIPATSGSALEAHVTVDEHTSQRLIAFEGLADESR